MRVRVRDERDAFVDRLTHPDIGQIEPLGSAIDLDPRARLRGGVDERLQIERVGIAPLQKAPGRV